MVDNRSKYAQNAGPQWIKIPSSYPFNEPIESKAGFCRLPFANHIQEDTRATDRLPLHYSSPGMRVAADRRRHRVAAARLKAVLLPLSWRRQGQG